MGQRATMAIRLALGSLLGILLLVIAFRDVDMDQVIEAVRGAKPTIIFWAVMALCVVTYRLASGREGEGSPPVGEG